MAALLPHRGAFTMIYPIAALLVLWFVLTRKDAPFRSFARMTRRPLDKVASIVAVLAALFVLIRGNLWLAVLLFGVALWLLGRASRRQPPAAASSGLARVRTTLLAMDYDPRTAHMSGVVIAGPFAGSSLAALDRGQCGQLYATSLKQDPKGARLLEAYLDRRFSGWRRVDDGDADRRAKGPSETGGMSEDEAYQLLGVRPGAPRQEIVRSHRAVMKIWHPDQGGTGDLAARANEAKEVLLRRHT